MYAKKQASLQYQKIAQKNEVKSITEIKYLCNLHSTFAEHYFMF